MPEDTPQRRSYRTADAPKREVATKRVEAPEDVPPAPESKSQERRYEAQGDGKSSFVNVTGLFRSKSGKADTVFVTEEIIDKFASMAVGDVLGVSENVNNGNLQIWYIVKKEE